jgi:hypothetical protein
MSGRSRGENIATPVLPDLQSKGQMRQRSLSTDLNFCFFCFKTKEVARRGNERHKATQQASTPYK